ncbi:MAG: N-acetyltransferase [Candidatus Altiarchaeota archaeon]|nr:N-acetyltransferase [Candidatus Altiarchaeota archaeon]
MDGKIRIRDFTPSDADSLLEIHEQSAGYFEDLGINRGFIINISQRGDFRFLVAELGGEMVGFIGALYYSNVGRGEIGPVCVEKSLRGRGFGSQLLENMFSFLKREGVSRVIARVKKRNTGGLTFFEGNGFQQEGFFKRYTSGGEDVVQLVKFI